MKKSALICAGLMLCATGAWAQGGNIVGFRATDPFYPAGTTFLDPGSKVSFTVRLAGNIKVSNPLSVPIPLLSYPSIQMKVGTSGSVRWATLKPGGWSYLNHGSPWARTDLDFEYIVQPGDMADPQPLELAGSATIPFTFFGGDLVFFDDVTGNTMMPSDWKVNVGLWGIPAGVNDSAFTQYDLTMTSLGFKVRTLYFSTLMTPVTLVASETKSCRIEMGVPSMTEAITLKVWTPDTAKLQINGVGPDGAATVMIPLGATYVDFFVKGIASGPATIYAQRQTDFIKNPLPFVSEAGVTNFVKHTINITPPPIPTVRVIFPDNMGLDTLTLDETVTPNTGQFKITLSEPFSNNVYVKMDVINYPGQMNIVLPPPDGGYYMVPANQLESTVYRFSAVDGTWDSENYGVELKPTVTNAPAAAYFNNSDPGTVFVKNVQPVTTVNTASDAMKGIPYNIGWTVSDVPADLAGGIIMEWNFGDGTSSIETNYSSTGTMSGVTPHTYLSDVPPVKNGSVTVRELKDPTKSTVVPFTVTVIPPVPTPSVSIVMDSYIGAEGSNGWLWVVLSELCIDPVTVTWTATLNGLDVINTNLSFSVPSVTIPPGSTSNMVPVRVNFLDGMPETESTGIVIQSIITGTVTAIIQFPAKNTWPLYIMNKPPTLDNPKPSVTPQPPYHAIPLGLPYTFTADVNDASAADAAAGYILQWRVVGFTSWTTTNAFEYTFLNESLYNVEVRVKDKDMGDDSDWSGVSVTSFIVNVVPPPPDPSITVDCSVFVYPEMDPVTGAPGGGSFKVIMSRSHPDPVPITLTLIPPPGSNPGAITLGMTSFTFQPGQALEYTVSFTIQDGTNLSEFHGFRIVPSIPAGDPALNTFKVFNDGYIYVQNVRPIIRLPIANTTSTAIVGVPFTFNWNITDVMADQAGLTNLWDFGDGTSATTYGASGSVTHTYQATGENLTVTLISIDKDGGISSIIFFITVWPPPSLTVTFDSDNNNATPTSQTVTQTGGNNYVLPPTPMCLGYLFAGWFTDRNGNGTQVTANTMVTQATAHTLYAYWVVAPSFEEALDSTSLAWQTGGDKPWFTQIAVSHDSPHAAQSGPIGDYQTSWIETIVTGLGTLSFWWKVSSEADDWLICTTNGVEAMKISGEVDWEQQVLEIADNETVTIRWTYAKDKAYAEGADCGWLDEMAWMPALTVTFDANGGTPEFQTKTVITGSTYGTLPDAIREGYDFAGWFTAQTGGEEVTSAIIVTQRVAYTLYAHWMLNFGEAVNAPNLDWRTGGDKPWFTQTAVKHDGLYAAQSGAIGNSQSTWIGTTVTGPGTLSFWWKVSSEDGWDWLICTTNGVEVMAITGETGWEQRVLEFTGGETVVRWVYEKDRVDIDDVGLDCGWLDEVVWTPSQAHTTGTPVHVPYDWLNSYLGWKGISDYEDLAMMQGANGYFIWESYVAGLIPTNAASKFAITNFVLDAEGRVSRLDWAPHRGDRDYKVWGKTNLTDGAWYWPTNAGSRFFKVEVKTF